MRTFCVCWAFRRLQLSLPLGSVSFPKPISHKDIGFPLGGTDKVWTTIALKIIK